MSGNNRSGIVLQDRDRLLLSELDVMRIIDRETAKLVAGFRSTTRANTRLLMLTRAGVLSRFFTGTISSGRKSVYTLSRKGAELVGAKFGGIHRASGRLVLGDHFIEHQSVVNDVYVALKYRPNRPADFRLRRWLSFCREVSESIKIKPDGYCEVQTGNLVRAMFLEVDLGSESLKEWQKKTAYYLQLAVSGEYLKRFHQPQFRVVVVCDSERRITNIRATVAKSTDKIFRFTTTEIINRDGFWSPIWLRPTGDQRQSLF
jgi:hypothetical protein